MNPPLFITCPFLVQALLISRELSHYITLAIFKILLSLTWKVSPVVERLNGSDFLNKDKRSRNLVTGHAQTHTHTAIALSGTGILLVSLGSALAPLPLLFLCVCRAQRPRPGDGTGRSSGLPGLPLCSAAQPRGPSEGRTAAQPPSPHHCLRTRDGVQLCGPGWHRCHIKGKDTLLCRWPKGLPLPGHKLSLSVRFKILWCCCYAAILRLCLNIGAV